MSNLERQSRLAVLAALPPGHPERGQFAIELAALEAGQREEWLRVQRESDLLRESLSLLRAMPAGLEQKLRAIPMTVAVAKKSPVRGFLIAAASLLIIASAAFLVIERYLDTDNTETHAPAALAEQAATEIADIALQIHQAPPALTVVSADPAVVEAALKDNKMPFPTILLKPTQPLTLLGGGICNFGPTRAIFTRWQSTSTPVVTYTLYQFDGGPLHVPAGFQRQMASPSSANQPLRVSLWPGYGNPCTWALVLEKPESGSPFYY